MLNETIINQLLKIARDFQGCFQYDIIGGEARIILSIGSNKMEVWHISASYDITPYDTISQKYSSPYMEFMITVNGIVTSFENVPNSEALEWFKYIITRTRSRKSFEQALIEIKHRGDKNEYR